MEISKKISERLKEHPYLCNLCLERKIEGEDCLSYNLKLEFCDFPNYMSEDRVTIVFSDVQNFKAQNLDGMLCTHLVVRDLRDRQLERIKYYVVDDEEEMFSFYCSSIELNCGDDMILEI